MQKLLLIFSLLLTLNLNLYGFFSKDTLYIFPASSTLKVNNIWLEIATQELIQKDFKVLKEYNILTTQDLQDKKQKFSSLTSITSEQASDIAKKLKIDNYVYTTYELDGSTVNLIVSLYKDGKIFTKEIKTPISDLIPTLSFELFNFLKSIYNLDDKYLDLFYANDPQNIIALQYYSKGMLELFAYNDTTLNAKASVDDLNGNKKAQMQRKLAQMRKNGTFDSKALSEMMGDLNSNFAATARKAGKVLDKKNLYNGVHYFKQAINSDDGYGYSYAQLANTIHTNIKIAVFSAPPKAYIQDMCSQAKSARVSATCKDDVEEFEEKKAGNVNCDVNSKLAKLSDKRYLQHAGNISNLLIDIQNCMQEEDKEQIIQELHTLLKYTKDNYKEKSIPTIKLKYNIAWIYFHFDNKIKAKNLYLNIETTLNNMQDKGYSTYKESLNALEASFAKKGIKITRNKKRVEELSRVASNPYDKQTAYVKYTIKIYNKLAYIYAQEKNYTQSKKYLQLLNKYSFDDLDQAIDILDISETYFELEEYQLALNKANLIIENIEAQDTGTIGRQIKPMQNYLFLGKLYLKNTLFDKAIAYADKAQKKVDNMKAMSRADDDKIQKILQKYYRNIEKLRIEISLTKNDSTSFAILYAEIADKKAQRLYTENTIHTMVNMQINRSLKPILESIKQDRKTLISLDPKNDTNEIKELKQKIARNQEQLSLIDTVNNIIDRKNFLMEKNLYTNIDEDTTILDFYSIHNQYYLFVITKGNIELVNLGKKQEIDKLIDSKDFANSSDLYTLLFKDLDIQTKKLLIIPDANFYLLPFEALYTGKGYLVQEYTISYLPSILMLKTKKYDPITQLTLFANPDYEQKSQLKQSLSSSRILRGVEFTSLPGTMLEAKKIQRAAAKVKLNVTLYTGKDASEGNFEKSIHSDILHIATHGYFIENARGYEATGIVLSGANTSIKNNSNEGIISAQKILNYYNFSDTQLIVLSACDTGAGEISTINTIQSLGNSFLMVGAQNVLMNLWEIPDIQTAYIMKVFYNAILVEKLSNAEAIRKAKLVMIQQGASYETWGALVLFGQ